MSKTLAYKMYMRLPRPAKRIQLRMAAEHYFVHRTRQGKKILLGIRHMTKLLNVNRNRAHTWSNFAAPLLNKIRFDTPEEAGKERKMTRAGMANSCYGFLGA